MNDTNCGQGCYYTQSPEMMFTNDKNVIYEDCSDNFCETESGIESIKNLESTAQSAGAGKYI